MQVQVPKHAQLGHTQLKGSNKGKRGAKVLGVSFSLSCLLTGD